MLVDRNPIEVQSTVTGDVAKMGIDPEAFAHIMNVLTDLYSDPEYAIVREYSTNAHDAHIEAGIQRAIEVTTPTMLSPFLTIKDYGVGLSVKDIHKTYSQYGASTKRGTNDQVGMLGLGCKSALTYADQFTVTSVKGGVRVQVLVSRDEDGAGSMTIVDTSATDEPNGVEIQIPCKRHNEIERKAAWFFSFWQPGTVLLNGKTPKPIEGMSVEDGKLLVVEGQDSNYVVMGNVPYPVEDERLNTGLSYRYNLVAFVPIGAITFTPSREALMYTAKTKDTLAQIEHNFKTAVQGSVQRHIDNCQSAAQAAQEMVRWSSILPTQSASFTFKGKDIPREFESKDGTHSITLVSRNSYVLSRHQTVPRVAVEAWANALWVHGYDVVKFTAAHRKKLDKYVADNLTDAEFGHFILTLDKPPAEWIASDRTIDWEDVRQIKLDVGTRTQGGVPRIPGSYDLYEYDGAADYQAGIPGDDVDRSDEGFTLVYGNANRWTGQSHARALARHYDSFRYVCLPANRIDKFKRLFPHAKTLTEAMQEAYDAWAKTLTNKDKLALAVHNDPEHERLKKLDAACVNDPELAEGIRLAKRDVAKMQAKLSDFRGTLDLKLPKWNNPLNKYPLARDAISTYGGGISNVKHVYFYINAVHEAANRKEQ